MDTSLRTSTREALNGFASRRRRLLWLKALFLFVAVAVPLLIGVAFLDRAFPLADGLRHGLSVVSYLLAAFVAIWFSLRKLFQSRDQRSLARVLGESEPALGEELLSAVELGEGADPSGSEVFQGMLQDDVANRSTGVDPVRLLPFRRIGLWCGLAVVAVISVIALCLVPSLLFGGFFARAALPFANLGRPSDIVIRVVMPEEPSRMVPFNEPVDLEIVLEGRRPDRVMLETQAGAAASETVELRRVESGRYAGAISVGEEDVRYRISAEGAVTPYFELDAMARPAIESFAKTYHPPAYSGRPVRKVEEGDGDLSALLDSTSTVEFRANQPIESAVLIASDKEIEGPLRIEVDGENLTAEIPISNQFISYRLEMVAKRSGFENTDPLVHEIEAIPDLPPVVELIEPSKGREVSPNEILTLVVSARDDVRLEKDGVAQYIAVNDSVPVPVILGSDLNGTEFFHERSWALGSLGLRDGDVVTTRMVAVDASGKMGESKTIRLRVVGGQSLAEERQQVEVQKKVAQEARDAAEAARELKDTLQDAKEQLRKPDRERTLAEEAQALKVESALAGARERSDRAFEALKEALEETESRTESAELTAAGERMAEMRAQNLDDVEEEVAKDNTDPDQAIREANELASKSNRLADQLEALAAQDTAAIAAEQLKRAKEQQDKVVEQANQKKPEQSEAIAEQAKAAQEAAQEAQADLAEVASLSQHNEQREADKAQERIDEAIAKSDEAMERMAEEKPEEHLQRATHEMKRGIDEAARTAENLEQRLAQSAERARKELLENAREPTERTLADARNTSSSPSPESAEKLEKAAKQMEETAEVYDKSQTSSPEQALDVSKMARALDSLADKAEEESVREEMDTLVDAQKTLEAEARAKELAETLESLEDGEPGADDLQAAREMMDELPKEFREARAEKEVSDAATEMQRSQENRVLEQAQRGLSQPLSRRKEPDTEKLAEAVEALSVKADSLQEVAESAADKAREQLAAMTPSLEESVEALAEAAAKAQENLEAAQASEPSELAEATNELAEAQVEAEEDLSLLQEALRMEANAADLSKEEERQEARAADIVREAFSQAQESASPAEALAEAAKEAEDGGGVESEQLAEAADALAERADALAEIAEAMKDAQQLAAMEEKLGISDALDEAYDQAEQLSEMADLSDEELMTALEAELAENSQMQEALSDIAAAASDQADAAVAQAAADEAALGESTAELAESSPSQPAPAKEADSAGVTQSAINESVAEAASDLERASRHEERLGNDDGAEQLSEQAEALQESVSSELAEAAEALSQNQSAQESAASVGKAAEALSELSGNAELPSQPSGEPDSPAAALAEALDQLDQQLNAPEPSSKPSTSSAESMAQVAQAQSEAMAQARAMGLTPGQEPPPASEPAELQMAKTPGEGSAEEPEEGNLEGKERSSDPLEIVELTDGDWGRLPADVAKDLSEAGRQEIAPEYREAIQNYYKALAERARGK